MTDEKYLPGLIVFYHSLVTKHGSMYPVVVMATEKLSQRGRDIITDLGCRIEVVERLSTGREAKVSQSSLKFISSSYSQFRQSK